MTEDARIRTLLGEMLAGAGVSPDEVGELVTTLEAVIEVGVVRGIAGASLRLGKSPLSAAIIRRLLPGGASLRADAKAAGLHPETLRRAEIRLEKLLTEKV